MLSNRELRDLVIELADERSSWQHLVRHDPNQRTYAQVVLNEDVGVWLICWMDDHDTGFHDHDVSAGAVAVVSAAVREEPLAIYGPVRQRTVDAGDSFHVAAADIHRVRRAGNDPAVTLHAYSPPLLRMGAYVIGEDGALARRPMSYAEELRPRERPG
jgi:predicted metal-dependent enzyme (double-stranded beta helix superfamily)